MLVVGLTGGIATGKSTVSSLLKAHSVLVVDADVIAREVVLPGTRTHSQIKEYFGNEVLLPDGSLDRPKLGTVIFGDEGKRQRLNAIVHPAVRRRMLWEVVKAWIRGHRYCVIDVPLLIETGLYKWVGKVIVVSWYVMCTPSLAYLVIVIDTLPSPEDKQLKRLVSRDKSSEEAALSRVKSQMPIAVKAGYADVVIDNAGGLDELEGQVSELIRQLKSETRWTWAVEWIIPPVGIASAALTLLVRYYRAQSTSVYRKDK